MLRLQKTQNLLYTLALQIASTHDLLPRRWFQHRSQEPINLLVICFKCFLRHGMNPRSRQATCRIDASCLVLFKNCRVQRMLFSCSNCLEELFNSGPFIGWFRFGHGAGC